MKPRSGDRQIIVITGNQSDCLDHAKKITAKLNCLQLSDSQKAHTFLGQEFDAVIFDCHQTFDANAFGAATGTIRGGGYLLLLKSDTVVSESLFLKRFWSLLDKYQHRQITALKNVEVLAQPRQINYATTDQNKAIDKIIHVVKGHRRRPLVITSDRGRGKSAALGIAAATLYQEGYKNIIICAPSKKIAAIIYKHALESCPECHLLFYSPDELQQQKSKADVVLIDEAAAIPISMLTGFLKRYSRIVFATTQHGYEGSGRGFAINFKKILNSVTPEWVNCELTTPIRWNENDTLEAFVFDALLLNAEPADIDIIKQPACTILKLDKAELIENTSSLSELFGLLVSAHYQTKPSDLIRILDDDLISIYAIEYKQQVIAVALLVQEGGIAPEIATDIFEGTRRLQGHLVAQSLAANVGIENAPCLRGERIIRIAVHPKIQQQGFGAWLLSSLMQKTKADYLSTSFGVTVELLRFWDKLNFKPVYLGMKRDASSGTHSVLMLYAKTTDGQSLFEEAHKRFAKHFPHLLSEPFKELETELALALLVLEESFQYQHHELQAFADKQRGYENTLYSIWKVVSEKLSSASSLKDDEKKILILKVLQKHSWKEVVKKMGGGVQGKKDALVLLRQAVSKLL